MAKAADMKAALSYTKQIVMELGQLLPKSDDTAMAHYLIDMLTVEVDDLTKKSKGKKQDGDGGQKQKGVETLN